MRNFRVHDKKVVLILSKIEAKALAGRLNQATGVRKSKALLRVEEELEIARTEVEYERT